LIARIYAISFAVSPISADGFAGVAGGVTARYAVDSLRTKYGNCRAVSTIARDGFAQGANWELLS